MLWFVKSMRAFYCVNSVAMFEINRVDLIRICHNVVGRRENTMGPCVCKHCSIDCNTGVHACSLEKRAANDCTR